MNMRVFKKISDKASSKSSKVRSSKNNSKTEISTQQTDKHEEKLEHLKLATTEAQNVDEIVDETVNNIIKNAKNYNMNQADRSDMPGVSSMYNYTSGISGSLSMTSSSMTSSKASIPDEDAVLSSTALFIKTSGKAARESLSSEKYRARASYDLGLMHFQKMEFADAMDCFCDCVISYQSLLLVATGDVGSCGYERSRSSARKSYSCLEKSLEMTKPELDMRLALALAWMSATALSLNDAEYAFSLNESAIKIMRHCEQVLERDAYIFFGNELEFYESLSKLHHITCKNTFRLSRLIEDSPHPLAFQSDAGFTIELKPRSHKKRSNRMIHTQTSTHNHRIHKSKEVMSVVSSEEMYLSSQRTSNSYVHQMNPMF